MLNLALHAARQLPAWLIFDVGQNMKVRLPSRFVLLQQEGHVIQSCLCIGLTQLRTASLSQKGTFYGAFFNLSIGFERLLKLVVILDFYLSHNLRFPSGPQLKSFGHDILHLYRSVQSLSKRRALNVTFPDENDAINQAIVAFLSDFAIKTRYSNLNNLQSGSRIDDPLSTWSNILNRTCFAEVPSSKKRMIAAHAFGFAPKLAQAGGIMIGSGLDGETLDLQKAYLEGGIVREATPYATRRVFEHLRPLKDVVEELVMAIHKKEEVANPGSTSVPYLQEFLIFLGYDPATVLRKKRWP